MEWLVGGFEGRREEERERRFVEGGWARAGELYLLWLWVVTSWGGAVVGEPAWWYQWVQAARRYSATEDGGDG